MRMHKIINGKIVMLFTNIVLKIFLYYNHKVDIIDC